MKRRFHISAIKKDISIRQHKLKSIFKDEEGYLVSTNKINVIRRYNFNLYASINVAPKINIRNWINKRKNIQNYNDRRYLVCFPAHQIAKEKYSLKREI